MARQRPVHEKPEVYRRARAIGTIALADPTLRAIRDRAVEKGDPIAVGEVAGLAAMKQTAQVIPYCHLVGLTGARVELRPVPDGLQVEAEAETIGRTGVEMEALLGATVALLTVWDMVKYLEKDPNGVYPNVRLGPIVLAEKEKGRSGGP